MTMEKFSEKSLLALGDYYVYGLIDPRDKKLFYIGKGTGNRVFNHEKESKTSPVSDKLKLKKITEIIESGYEVEKIIINSNLTEAEAYAAEAALINAFNYVSNIGLTNISSGHHSTEAMTVERFEREYGAEILSESDIKHKILVIKINKLYDRNMTREELLSLDHLAIAEVTKFVHIHTEDGYIMTDWVEGDDIMEYSGSACYYMPIRENYTDYRIITLAEHTELEKQREEAVELKNKEIENEQ